MNSKKIPVLSIVLYVLTGLLVLYAIWAAFYSFDYISTMIAQNQLVISGNEFEIASFYMSNFAQYALFAVILFALGRILQTNAWNTAGRRVVSSEDFLDDEDDEEELEELFENNDK